MCGLNKNYPFIRFIAMLGPDFDRKLRNAGRFGAKGTQCAPTSEHTHVSVSASH